MRNNISLSGTWQFQLDPNGTLSPDSLSPDREIRVPLPWQAAHSDLQQYSGFAWYRRRFDVGAEQLGGELLLKFGAVDYWCQVFVNGQLVGEHEGGYMPFSLPISSAVRAGGNELVVRVFDPVQSGIEIARWPHFGSNGSEDPAMFNAADIPHGKQEWYVNVGGIWQDVSLVAVPRKHISHVTVTPDRHTGQVRFNIELSVSGIESEEGSLSISVHDAAGEQVGTTVQIEKNASTAKGVVDVRDPHLWSDLDPHLYTATIRLRTPLGEDEVSMRFGFRDIETQNGKLMLNGEPLYLLAVLDQDLYPDTIYTIPSEDYLRDQFRKAKELGFNCLRCHIKPPDPLYLDLADEMGLLVWSEVPSWRTFHSKGTAHENQIALDDAIKQRVERILEEMIRRDGNHPSIIIWTIVNEDWGTALPLSEEDRAWVRRMYDRCKELDPTRLVVDNSPCAHQWGPSIHVKSDLDDFHIYANIPDQARSFAQTMEQYALRPAWTYSNHGDADRRGDEPLVLSEFGNWGLPSLKALRRGSEHDPAWFGVGPWWSRWEGEAGWPAGVEGRLKQLGLDAIWPDYEEFAVATQWHQYAAMKFEIEAMRRQPTIEGYVVTELADAYWESNGLLDFDRNKKVYHDLFRSINAPDVLPIQAKRYACWDDEAPDVRVFASHYSDTDWSGTSLECGPEGASQAAVCEVGAVRRGQVERLLIPPIAVPRVVKAQSIQVDFRLRSAGGDLLARNSLDLLVLPSEGRKPLFKGEVAVITRHNRTHPPATGAPMLSPDQGVAPVAPLPGSGQPLPRGSAAEGRVGLDLERTLDFLGYQTTDDITPATKMAVTNYPNANLLQWVREGGDLLYLSRGPGPFFWTQTRGTAYGGNWITTFSWLRPEVHRRLKAPNPLGLPFMHIMPTLTILGLPVEDKAFHGDFLAGLIAGWVRHPAVHTVQFRYGKGRVIMSTFVLEENLHLDPVAAAMFHDLLEHLASDRCQPALSVK